jgi:hypothetical protein
MVLGCYLGFSFEEGERIMSLNWLRGWIRRKPRSHKAYPSKGHRRPRWRPHLEDLEGRLAPATVTVNSLTDTGTGSSGSGDLRYCLTQANNQGASSSNTIQFQPGLSGTISLNSPLPAIQNNLTLTGPGASVLTVNGESHASVLVIGSATGPVETVSISGLTITRGKATGTNGSGPQGPGATGGGIDNISGTVTISSCTITGNDAFGPYTYGGGIFNNLGMTMTVFDSTISNNTSSGSGGSPGNNGEGGGIYNNSGIMTISNCTVSGNRALNNNPPPGQPIVWGVGGGIENNAQLAPNDPNDGHMTIIDSTVSGNNHAGDGGGIAITLGTLTMINSTVSNNSADNSGGGVFGWSWGGTLYFGKLSATNCTLADNSASNGGGLYVTFTSTVLTNVTITGNTAGQNPSGGGLYVYSLSGETLRNTLLAGNQSYNKGVFVPDDVDVVHGSPLSTNSANNLIGDGANQNLVNGKNGNQVGSATSPIDPKLDPNGLQNNGGPTLTIGLLSGSPALGAGTAPDTLSQGLANTTSPTKVYLTNGGQYLAVVPNTTVLLIDSEQMLVTGRNADGSYNVQRGYNGNTYVTTHAAGTPVSPPIDQRHEPRWRNDPAGMTIDIGAYEYQTLVISGLPSTITAGATKTFTVTAMGVGYTGTVHFTSSDPQAVLPPDSQLTNSVGSFSVTFKTAGSQTLTVTDTATGTITGTATVYVVAAAASQFAVSTSAANPDFAGTHFDVTVTAQDPYGNPASSYTGTVHFTSTDGQAVLPADYPFVAADNGVHTFKNGATLKTAGIQTVTATDIANGTITGSATTTVVPAAAATLVLTGLRTSVKAGQSFTATVTALDPYNNVATGYTGTVHFTSSDALAVLPSDHTFTTGTGADNGVHAFQVTLNTANSQSITVTDTLTNTITGTAGELVTGPFTVTNTKDAGAGSLRQAILNANAYPGTDSILFNIPTTDPGYQSSTGSFRITLASALPTVTDPVIIDGTTQPGYAQAGHPLIQGKRTSKPLEIWGCSENFWRFDPHLSKWFSVLSKAILRVPSVKTAEKPHFSAQAVFNSVAITP